MQFYLAGGCDTLVPDTVLRHHLKARREAKSVGRSRCPAAFPETCEIELSVMLSRKSKSRFASTRTEVKELVRYFVHNKNIDMPNLRHIRKYCNFQFSLLPHQCEQQYTKIATVNYIQPNTKCANHLYRMTYQVTNGWMVQCRGGRG